MVALRRRATPNSTVAAADKMPEPYFKETSILKKVAPTITSDDWECFLLVEATIYDRDGKLANQLSVDLKGPFIIRGKLDLEKDQEKHLVSRPGKCRDAQIQIETSTSFSIGLKDAEIGPPLPVLWASGESGWYEIVPSKEYQAVGNAMFQAISLHYSVADQYEEAYAKLPKKKGSKKKTRADVQLDINEVLFKASVQEGDHLTLPESIERCDDNAVFFLSHFDKVYQFYKWLAARHPNIVTQLAERKTQESIPISVPGLQAANPNDPKWIAKSASHDKTTNGRKSRGNSREQSASFAKAEHKLTELSRRPKKQSPAVKEDVEMQDSSTGPVKTGLDAVLDTLEELRETNIELMQSGGSHKPFKDIKASSICSTVYLQCSISKHKGGEEVCQYFAKGLVDRLDKSWHGSDFYKWAKENINTTPAFEFISEDKILGVTRRKKKPRPSAKDKGQQHLSTPRTPAAPSSGKQLPHPGQTGGKRSSLRPVASKKRHRGGIEDSDDEMDIDSDDHRVKKSRFDDSESSDDDGYDDVMDSPLTKLVVISEKLPTTYPQGPNSTWTCEEPDCGFVVRGADDDEGQEKVNQHLEEHERAARELMQEQELSRINLAMVEGKKGHMPIDHLLEKIRSLGGDTGFSRDQTTTTDDGQPLPQPIKRSLLI